MFNILFRNNANSGALTMRRVWHILTSYSDPFTQNTHNLIFNKIQLKPSNAQNYAHLYFKFKFIDS